MLSGKNVTMYNKQMIWNYSMQQYMRCGGRGFLNGMEIQKLYLIICIIVDSKYYLSDFLWKAISFYIMGTCTGIRSTCITLRPYQLKLHSRAEIKSNNKCVQHQMLLKNCYIWQIWKHDIWHNELKCTILQNAWTVMHRKTKNWNNI